MRSTSHRVLVLGGGIAGLSAAFELASRGIPFTLCEASGRLGGLIHTEHAGGFMIEAGPDAVLAQKPAAIQLCEAVGLGSALVASLTPRTAFVLDGERLHPLPSPSVLGVPLSWRGIATYSLLPWTARLRLACEPLVRTPAPGDESVGAFFRRRFGPATVDRIAQPLLGGIHAGDVDRLSVRSLFPRFVEAEARHGSVLRGVQRDARPPAGGAFRSLSGGMSMLVAAIAARLPAGSVRVNAPATHLAPTGGGWRVTAGADTLEAGAVILALPARTAAGLLSPIDADAAALCAEVPYVSTASVALAWRREEVPHPLAGSGFVVARARTPRRITACTWVSSKWPGRAPEGFALLRAFVGGAHDPEAVALDDEALAEFARRDIAAVLGIAAPPRLTRVHRWHDAGAQHTVGHLARMAAIDTRLRALPGLFVAGSGFRAIGIPDCVADGRAAAASGAAFVTMAGAAR